MCFENLSLRQVSLAITLHFPYSYYTLPCALFKRTLLYQEDTLRADNFIPHHIFTKSFIDIEKRSLLEVVHCTPYNLTVDISKSVMFFLHLSHKLMDLCGLGEQIRRDSLALGKLVAIVQLHNRVGVIFLPVIFFKC